MLRIAKALLLAVVVGATARAAAPNQELKQLLDDAAKAWADGRTQDTIALLETAYAKSNASRIVFNLARAYERAKENEKAIRLYEQYLDLPDTEALALKRTRASLAVLYREVTRTPAPAVPEPASEPSISTEPVKLADAPVEVRPPLPPVSPVATEPIGALSVKEPGPTPLRTTGLVVGGVGVAALVASATFGFLASSLASRSRSSVDPVEKPALRDAALTDATVSDVTLIAGGALTLTGLGAFLLGAR